MEAHALLLLLQWALRSCSRFHKRLIIGIDAQAVLYAAVKGRTSAPSLKYEVRRIAAHCLAGDLLAHFLWMPSKHNPSDKPSRGLRHRSVHRRPPPAQRPSRLQRALSARDRSIRHLIESGMLSDGSDSGSATSSSYIDSWDPLDSRDALLDCLFG